VDGTTSDIAVSADGNFLASAEGRAIRIRDLGSLNLECKEEALTSISADMPDGQIPVYLAFAPGDHEVLVSSREGNLFAWEWRTGIWRSVASNHRHPIGRLWVVPKSKLLISATSGGALQLGSCFGGPTAEVFGADSDDSQYLAISPNGQTVAVAVLDSTVRLLHAATGRTTLELPKQEGRVCAVAFTPDGSALITATALQIGTEIRIWPAREGG
jgi:WD40 repeat protein